MELEATESEKNGRKEDSGGFLRAAPIPIYTYSKGLGMQCAAGNGNEQPPENFSHFGAGPVRPAADDARTASHGLRDPRDSRH